MIETTATVPTANAQRYVTQLCKHWAHKLSVELTEEHGVVRFENGVAMFTPKDQALKVQILANDQPTAEKLQDVVARHLDRFAFREAPLAFIWQASDPNDYRHEPAHLPA